MQFGRRCQVNQRAVIAVKFADGGGIEALGRKRIVQRNIEQGVDDVFRLEFGPFAAGQGGQFGGKHSDFALFFFVFGNIENILLIIGREY